MDGVQLGPGSARERMSQPNRWMAFSWMCLAEICEKGTQGKKDKAHTDKRQPKKELKFADASRRPRR